jgi:hypothetical protein
LLLTAIFTFKENTQPKIPLRIFLKKNFPPQIIY